MIENSTTKSMEGFGRARGLYLQIRKIEGQKNGLFFAISQDGAVFQPPKPLGKSRLETEEAICALANTPYIDDKPLVFHPPKKPTRLVGDIRGNKARRQP